MLYMVSYDLMKPGQDYKKLDNAIKLGGGVEILKSQWLLPSTSKAVAIYGSLSPLVDSNDRLSVNEVTNNSAWATGKLMVTDQVILSLFTTHARN